MPIGTVTKRFDNEKNIRVTFDNGGKDKSYSTNKRVLYPVLQEGNTVNYTLEQNGEYWNIVSAVTLENSGSAPAASGPAVGRSILTEKDTLIVDQVLFKGAIDKLVKGDTTPQEAASDAVLTWNWVLYYRHGGNSPLVEAAIREGGQVFSGEFEPEDAPGEEDDV
jgi:hypothetical protein